MREYRTQAQALLARMLMRRALALAGFFLVLALAGALLWRVYLHHAQATPYTDEPTVVSLDGAGRTSVKIARAHR